MATTSTADALLKEMYLPPIKEQLNNTNRTLAQFDENTEDVVGREVVLPLHTNRNSGVGFRKEGENTPTPGQQGWANATATTKTIYARGSITAQMLAKMETDQGAFLRALPSEQDPLIDDAKRRIGFHLFGDGDGVVATCGTTTASTTVQLASTTERRQLLLLQEGAVIDLGVAGNYTSVASNRTVTAVNVSAKTITISGAAVSTVDGTTLVTFTGEGGTGSNQRVITGLNKIVDSTGAVFGVDPSTQPRWSSYENAVSGPINLDVLETAVDEAEILGGVMTDLIITTHGVRRRYAGQLQDQIRYADLSLKGGFNADLTLSVGAAPIPMIVDRNCQEGTMYGVVRREINQYVGQDWQFIVNPGTGSVLHFDIDTASFHFLLQKQTEIATGKRNAHWKLTDIDEG